jgi:ribonuclease HI
MHRNVVIFTDSLYSIKCVTLWHIKWIKNNWMTSLGRPVENQDLVIQILEKLKEREEYGSKTSFEWVQAHTGLNIGNSQADKLANEGAKMTQKVLHRHRHKH